MVMFSFLILGTAFVFLGRSYVISEYRDNMVSNAEEVSHAAQALVRDGELSNWDLRMVISTLAQSTGNHIFITNTDGFAPVADDDILRGMKLLLLDGKLLCEPSSAIGMGAALCGQLPLRRTDKVCFVISGGSVALEQLHRLEDVRL